MAGVLLPHECLPVLSILPNLRNCNLSTRNEEKSQGISCRLRVRSGKVGVSTDTNTAVILPARVEKTPSSIGVISEAPSPGRLALEFVVRLSFSPISHLVASLW